MKPICPSCDRELSADDINVSEGVAHCPDCNEIYDLSDLADDGQGEAPRVEKPEDTRIQSFIADDSIGFIMPPAGFSSLTIFLIFWNLIWNGVSGTMFVVGITEGDVTLILFLIPFVLIGLASLLFLFFQLFGRTGLMIDRDRTVLGRKLFGFNLNKKRQTANINNVGEMEIYRQNDRPVYGVGINFSNGSPISFGSYFTQAEKEWVIGEITHVWRNVT